LVQLRPSAKNPASVGITYDRYRKITQAAVSVE
jgi:hypothetical protein